MHYPPPKPLVPIGLAQDIAGPKVRPRTADMYDYIIRFNIVPVIGRVRLDRLTPGHVSALIQAATAAGLSPRTAQIVHGVLTKVAV